MAASDWSTWLQSLTSGTGSSVNGQWALTGLGGPVMGRIWAGLGRSVLGRPEHVLGSQAIHVVGLGHYWAASTGWAHGEPGLGAP